jgi:hypothetical protein
LGIRTGYRSRPVCSSLGANLSPGPSRESGPGSSNNRRFPSSPGKIEQIYLTPDEPRSSPISNSLLAVGRRTVASILCPDRSRFRARAWRALYLWSIAIGLAAPGHRARLHRVSRRRQPCGISGGRNQ